MTAVRVISLPAVGLTVSLGTYIKAVKTTIANPDTEFKHGLTTWWPTKGRDIAKQFLDGVTDRINQGIPHSQRGAK